MSITYAELGDRLESSPLSLIGQTYLGQISIMPDDSAYALHYGDYILVIDFDRTILEVLEQQ